MSMYKATQFSIDTVGAYVTELYDEQGEAVLFPRTLIGEKLRGGSHVCFPYFGPDAAGVMAQHGFGRTVTWQTEVSADNRTVTCTYTAQDAPFTHLAARLRYQLNEAGDTFTSILTVTNNGDTPCTVTPGFHPYFAVNPNDVRLNGQQILLKDFEPFQEFPDQPEITLQTGDRAITVTSDSLSHAVVWSDAKDAYLCVEPTKAGNAFDSADTSRHALLPGETVEYVFSISW